MDIKVIEAKKRELELGILKLIQKFEEETGCSVDDNGGIYYTKMNTVEPEGNLYVPVHIR